MIDQPNLVAQIDHLADGIDNGDCILDTNQRQCLLHAVRRLTSSLETPFDKTASWAFGLHRATMMRIAVEMGVFDVFRDAEHGRMTVSDLARSTKADAILVRRVMRFLEALGLFHSEAADTYVANTAAQEFIAESPLSKWLLRYHDVQARTLTSLPRYLKETNFANPSSSTNTPFQFEFGTKLTHFEWLKQNPRQLQAFNSWMTVHQDEVGYEWYDFYPFEEKGLAWAKAHAHGKPLLVDVGGGVGHDLKGLEAAFTLDKSDHTLVLQDLPDVVENVSGTGSNVQVMGYNFFDPQPVSGARFYYLRNILHDWPDDDCRRILSNLRDAMEPDSILLLNEFIMPETNASFSALLIDLTMMATYSSMERTESLWTELLNEAGFDVMQIWTPAKSSPGDTSLIEAKARTRC